MCIRDRSRAKAVFIPPAKLVVVARSSYPIQRAGKSADFPALCYLSSLLAAVQDGRQGLIDQQTQHGVQQTLDPVSYTHLNCNGYQPRTRSSSRAEATHCRISQLATTCSSLQPLRLRTWSWRGVRVFFKIQMCRKRFRLIFRMPKLPSADVYKRQG